MIRNYKANQNRNPNSPSNDNESHRVETAVCLCLICWITADILVAYGHNDVASVFFYLAILFPAITFAYHARKGWQLRWQISIGIVVFVLIACPLFLKWASYVKSFSVLTYAASPLAYTRDKVSFMWCVHETTNGIREASPIYLPFYFKFVNQRDSPMFIDSIYIERQAPNGKWEMMPIIETHPRYRLPVDFYIIRFNTGSAFTWTNFYESFKNAQNFLLVDDLQQELSEKSLEPNESANGWIMMDIPKDGWTGKWRFTAVIGGKSITRPVEDIGQLSEKGIQLHSPFPAWRMMEYKDISGLPLRYYSDDTPCEFLYGR